MLVIVGVSGVTPYEVPYAPPHVPLKIIAFVTSKAIYIFGLKIRQIPLLQYLFPVGLGPSSNICP